jgi:quinolinate synthase
MSEPTDTPHRLPVAGQAPPLGLNADELEDGIRRLKAERNAVILAHYYQESSSRTWPTSSATRCSCRRPRPRPPADVIAFCGVHFMAETAKILNPDKVVVVPDLEAGCSLADGCPAPAFAAGSRSTRATRWSATSTARPR